MADAVDVVVAGGGPAGATLAILLGRAGLRVDLYDARRFPREKPCGEGIMPAGRRRAGAARPARRRRWPGAFGRALPRLRDHRRGAVRAARAAAAIALAQRRLRLDDALRRRGARDRRACGYSRTRRSRARPSRTAAPSGCASAASSGAPRWWSAPTGSSRGPPLARARRPRARAGPRRRPDALPPGGRTRALRSPEIFARPRPRALRGAAARRRAAGGRRWPTTARWPTARARRWSAGSPASRSCARCSRARRRSPRRRDARASAAGPAPASPPAPCCWATPRGPATR